VTESNVDHYWQRKLVNSISMQTYQSYRSLSSTRSTSKQNGAASHFLAFNQVYRNTSSLSTKSALNCGMLSNYGDEV
jgi:hypothetical protein